MRPPTETFLDKRVRACEFLRGSSARSTTSHATAPESYPAKSFPAPARRARPGHSDDPEIPVGTSLCRAAPGRRERSSLRTMVRFTGRARGCILRMQPTPQEERDATWAGERRTQPGQVKASDSEAGPPDSRPAALSNRSRGLRHYTKPSSFQWFTQLFGSHRSLSRPPCSPGFAPRRAGCRPSASVPVRDSPAKSAMVRNSPARGRPAAPSCASHDLNRDDRVIGP